MKNIQITAVIILLITLLQGCCTTKSITSQKLSPPAQDFVDAALSDLPKEGNVDYHTHILGLETKLNGTFVNTNGHIFSAAKAAVIRSAAGVGYFGEKDEQYLSRLTQLIQDIPGNGKYGIMAFDKHFTKEGIVNVSATEIFVPNEYVVLISQKYPDHFFPIISVHPYRPFAAEELKKWAAIGVKYVKWLPNSMGINPDADDPRVDRFYEIMKENDMILISHTGEEQAVKSPDFQKFGNPILLRKPLLRGVKVIMAHAASLGKCEDLDRVEKPEVDCFSLFLKVMKDKKYSPFAFGDISAVTQRNRYTVLKALLENEEIHSQLVNGSDYPLPAVNVIISLKKIRNAGYITKKEEKLLREIFHRNPLLFDLVLKRTIKHPKTNKKFPLSMFVEHPDLKISKIKGR